MRQHAKPSPYIGQNIQKARISRQLTQEQLAAQIQVLGYDLPRGTLAKIETGTRHVTADELKFLKMALGIKFEDFYIE